MIFRQKPADLTPGKKPSMRELRLYELRKSKPFILDVAREYKRMIDSGKVASQAELARKMGLSRARVTQVLNALQVDPEVITNLSHQKLRYGMTERYFRSIATNK